MDANAPSLVNQIPVEKTGDVYESHTRPHNELYLRPAPLVHKVTDDNILRKHIPKQEEINRMLELIKRKVLRDYHLPVDARTLKTEQRQCPFFP